MHAEYLIANFEIIANFIHIRLALSVAAEDIHILGGGKFLRVSHLYKALPGH